MTFPRRRRIYHRGPKACSQVAIKQLKKKKKEAKSIPGSVKESITSKGQRVSGSKARRGVELDGIRFERLGRGEFLGCYRVAGVQWVREPPKARHLQVA